MPRFTAQNPSYRRHRGSGQAVVTVNGTDHYLGPWDTQASKRQYDRVIGEWLANGRRPPAADSDITVAELARDYLRHCATYYRRADGTPTSEVASIKLPIGVLLKFYKVTPARDFGPLALAVVRNAMIEKGWARGSINTHVGRLKRMFAWGVSREILPPSVSHALATVRGLRAGRSAARESSPVLPVPDAVVEQTLPFMPAMVGAMVKLQRLTGARPGEICNLKQCDIDRTDAVWLITPSHHKTIHHGHGRTIHVGHRAQAVLLPYLDLVEPNDFIFTPAASETARRAARTAARRTPAGRGNAIGTNRCRRPKRVAGDRYDVGAYRHAIQRACDAAFPAPAPIGRQASESVRAWRERLTPGQRVELSHWRSKHRWHPHQLRHTAATEMRRRFGVEMTRTVLGHSQLSATEIYAEQDVASARAVAAAIG